MESLEHEERHIIEYVEVQAEEKVQRLEKVASERIFGRKHDVWDVHTDQARWWVITSPTNLYLQEEHPSMDYALSFHVGLWQRVAARQQPSVGGEEQDRVAGAWRKWQQAADAMEQADEAEEFQAVGMRCREALLAFVRETASELMLPPTAEAPKMGDFIHWSEHIAQTIAPGGSSERVRSHLKSVARGAWDLARWLTHERDATRFDAMLTVDATEARALQHGARPVREACPTAARRARRTGWRRTTGQG